MNSAPMSTTTTDPRDVIAKAREIAAELRNRVGIEYSPQGDPYEVVDDFEQDTASTLESLAAERSHWMAETKRLLKAGQDALSRAEAAEAANAELRAALEVAKRTIEEGGSGGVTCTVWVPEDVSLHETLVDHIDAALDRAASLLRKGGADV